MGQTTCKYMLRAVRCAGEDSASDNHTDTLQTDSSVWWCVDPLTLGQHVPLPAAIMLTLRWHCASCVLLTGGLIMDGVELEDQTMKTQWWEMGAHFQVTSTHAYEHFGDRGLWRYRWWGAELQSDCLKILWQFIYRLTSSQIVKPRVFLYSCGELR